MDKQLEKEVFISFVVETIKTHPDWIGALLYAVQCGVAEALQVERIKVSNLAYGYSDMIYNKETRKRAKRMQSGLKELYKFFVGAPFAKDVKELLEDENN